MSTMTPASIPASPEVLTCSIPAANYRAWQRLLNSEGGTVTSSFTMASGDVHASYVLPVA